MPKRLSLEEKACRIIEVLVSDDFCEDLEFKIAVHQDYTLKPEDVITVNQKFCIIYELSHSANPTHSCHNVHNDWRKTIEQRYRYFRRKGYLKPSIRRREVRNAKERSQSHPASQNRQQTYRQGLAYPV